MNADVVLYGLCVRSHVALLQARPARAGMEADLEIVMGSPMAPNMARPDGTVMAEDVLSETEWYCFVREPSGYLLRYASACDLLVSLDLRRVVVRPVVGVDPDRVSVFVSGGLLAFVLMMRGDLVLHASAVGVLGQAVAFVGRSGMGKSTMATLCCRAGAPLVTDDVLRLEMSEGVPRCYLGAGELRLRPSSADLADGFDVRPKVRPTGDGRGALTAPSTAPELLPLRAVVIPYADRTATSLSLLRLDPMQALLALLSFPRLPGWADPESQAGLTQQLGRLVEQVDIFAGRIPWGPPFPADLVQGIFEEVGVSPPDRRRRLPGG